MVLLCRVRLVWRVAFVLEEMMIEFQGAFDFPEATHSTQPIAPSPASPNTLARLQALLALPQQFPAGCKLIFRDINRQEIGRSVSIDPGDMTLRSAPVPMSGHVCFIEVHDANDGYMCEINTGLTPSVHTGP
jgi:hypothetical protein